MSRPVMTIKLPKWTDPTTYEVRTVLCEILDLRFSVGCIRDRSFQKTRVIPVHKFTEVQLWMWGLTLIAAELVIWMAGILIVKQNTFLFVAEEIIK